MFQNILKHTIYKNFCFWVSTYPLSPLLRPSVVSFSTFTILLRCLSWGSNGGPLKTHSLLREEDLPSLMSLSSISLSRSNREEPDILIQFFFFSIFVFQVLSWFTFSTFQILFVSPFSLFKFCLWSTFYLRLDFSIFVFDSLFHYSNFVWFTFFTFQIFVMIHFSSTFRFFNLCFWFTFSSTFRFF